jgi:excisionase family DNA binding protein
MADSLAEPLAVDDQKVVSEIHHLLKDKSAHFSPSRLAELAGVAFEITFTGATTEEKLANALARGLAVREKMAAEEGGSLSTDEAARYLGFSKQSVLNLYHAGKLLAWRTEKQGALRFPGWQFAEHRRLPGLEQVLAKLNQAQILDDWAKIGFFLQTHGLLDDRRPLDLLRENALEPVLKVADAYV